MTRLRMPVIFVAKGNAVIQGQAWDAQSFGIGVGGLLAGVGVAVGLKK